MGRKKPNPVPKGLKKPPGPPNPPCPSMIGVRPGVCGKCNMEHYADRILICMDNNQEAWRITLCDKCNDIIKLKKEEREK